MDLSVYTAKCNPMGGESAIKITLSGWLGDCYLLEEEWITKEMLEEVLKGTSEEQTE